MRILVQLNQVLDPAGFTVNRRAQRLFINSEDYVTNPADLCALEAALQVKDETGCEVIVLCIGPERVQDAICHGLALGADRGIHLFDEEFETTDPTVLARILAAAAARLSPFTLFLAGDRVWDSDGGQVPARVGELLNLAQMMSVEKVSVRDGIVTAIQAINGGFQQLEGEAPVLATFSPGANRIRYGTAARLMNVYRNSNAVERWSAGDLGLAPAGLVPLTRSGGQNFPPPKELGIRLEGPAGELAQRLKAALSR